MARIILASASPRRREICDRLGLDYEVIPAKREEALDPALPMEQAVVQVARAKAAEVAAAHPDRLVLGADTTVTVDGKALGKPRDEQHAAAMLNCLQGRWHRVITGVWVCAPSGSDGFAACTEVRFAPMTAADITAYIATGEPMDKAGAYGIQGAGLRFVEEIRGDFYAVMGLPAASLWDFLKKFPEMDE